MQNKPNLKDAQMNVSIYSQMNYENISNRTLGQNKPNQSQLNPIKPNLVRRRRIQKAQNERKLIYYRGL